VIEIIPNDLPRAVTVSARKFDGREHRRWRAELIRQQGALLVLDAIFENEVIHDLMGRIERGTISQEFYWLDRWYNIFRFLTPRRDLLYYYCNVNKPPEFDGNCISYVDLDIDVLVRPDFSHRVLDLDEFESNAEHFGYPENVKSNAHRAVSEIIELIEDRRFPFNQLVGS